MDDTRNSLINQTCELIGDETVSPIIDSCLAVSNELTQLVKDRLGKQESLAVDYFLGSLLTELADAALTLGFVFGVNSAAMLTSGDPEAARRRILEQSGLDQFRCNVALEVHSNARA